MHPAVPSTILQRLQAITAGLPQSREEAAWVGVRWRVRTRTYAHVLMIDEGWPPAYAEAAGTKGPACLLTFRSSVAELDPQHYSEAHSFGRAGGGTWWAFASRRTQTGLRSGDW